MGAQIDRVPPLDIDYFGCEDLATSTFLIAGPVGTVPVDLYDAKTGYTEPLWWA